MLCTSPNAQLLAFFAFLFFNPLIVGLGRRAFIFAWF